MVRQIVRKCRQKRGPEASPIRKCFIADVTGQVIDIRNKLKDTFER